MKRFHVHVVVEDINKSVDFYSHLFGEQPTKRRDDYAKWMLKDSLLNFAISAKGHSVGVDHFGFQVNTLQELEELKQHTETAIGSGNVLDPQNTSCCYAKSEKYWSIDPTGLTWEHFYTHSDIPEFGCDNDTQEGSCCIPLHHSGDNQSSPCCIPNNPVDNDGACCG